MSKTFQNLSSEEAVLAFKQEIDNCLALLGFLNSKDKENLWKYWKTVTSAVKIALNGKGSITSFKNEYTSMNEKNERERDNEENLRLKNVSRDAITIYVPLACSDRGHRRFHVFKFLNQQKIEDYVEEIISSSESNQDLKKDKIVMIDSGEFPNLGIAQSDIAVNPDKFVAHLSQFCAGNPPSQDEMVKVEISDNNKVLDRFTNDCSITATNSVTNSSTSIPMTVSNSVTLSQNKHQIDEKTQFSHVLPKKQKPGVKTWPVGKPTTRSSSRVQGRYSIHKMPVKMKDNGCVKIGKTKTISPETNGVVECLSEDTKTPSIGELSFEEPSNSTVVQLTNDKLSSCPGEEKESEVQMETNISQSKSSDHLSQETVESGENAEFIIDEVAGDQISDTLIRTDFGSSLVNSTILEKGSLDIIESENVQIPQTIEVKPVISDQDVVENEDVVDEAQQINDMQDQLPNTSKTSSDIETIISALEEELKKSGSGVHSISVTSAEKISYQDDHSSQGETVEILPSQEIVEVDDVIWNQDGTVHVVETNTTLIDTAHAMTSVNDEGTTVIQPIDAQYDVVEYEVLAEKGKTRSIGSRKRKKDKDSVTEDKDAVDRTCPMCHRVLTYPSSMAAHMRIHTGDRPYSCGQCNRKFTTKANRDRHEATHVGLKPFKCSECDKCFTEKRSLKIHMRTHTGERPYVCTVCGRGFAQKCTLMVHMDRHTNRKGHLCDLCGKAFRQKCQLDIHVKRHNRQANYPCSECPVKCYTRGDLVRHMIKHTGERPFQCTLCPRTFTRKQYLMDHENTHFGRKPYKCSICSMTFHDMGSCHRHLRKHREETEAGKSENETKPSTILTADDYNTIVKGSQAGKIVTLEDGSQALVTAVDIEADGSTVYHITCVDGQFKVEEVDNDKVDNSNPVMQELKPVVMDSVESSIVSIPESDVMKIEIEGGEVVKS